MAKLGQAVANQLMYKQRLLPLHFPFYQDLSHQHVLFKPCFDFDPVINFRPTFPELSLRYIPFLEMSGQLSNGGVCIKLIWCERNHQRIYSICIKTQFLNNAMTQDVLILLTHLSSTLPIQFTFSFIFYF